MVSQNEHILSIKVPYTEKRSKKTVEQRSSKDCSLFLLGIGNGEEGHDDMGKRAERSRRQEGRGGSFSQKIESANLLTQGIL
jgi:hypothetical protein